MSMLTVVSFCIGIYAALSIALVVVAAGRNGDRDPPDSGGDR